MARNIRKLPAKLAFRGSGIALVGTLGEHCCRQGHARVLIDGHETFDATGIWQNKSSSGRKIPDTVLFSWRWRRAARGCRRIELDTSETNENAVRLYERHGFSTSSKSDAPARDLFLGRPI